MPKSRNRRRRPGQKSETESRPLSLPSATTTIMTTTTTTTAPAPTPANNNNDRKRPLQDSTLTAHEDPDSTAGPLTRQPKNKRPKFFVDPLTEPPLVEYTKSNPCKPQYSLPCVTDPELLQIFSEGNTDHIETVGSDFLTFNTLAWVGDSLLQHHFRLRLSRLFGYVNHDLTRCIYPYAKGNEFLAIIGKHYSLDKWLKKFDYKDQKLWADVVEAWIGMVEIERDLWLYDERVGELEYWLEWLCLMRYGDTIRDLDSGVYLWGKNTTENVQLKHEKVLFSGGRIDTPERPSDKAKGYRVQARFPPRATTTFKDETGSEQRESLEDTDKKENIRRDEIEKEELVGRAFSRSLKFAQDLAREKLCARIFSYYIPELNLVKDQQKQTILSTSSSSHTISSPESLNNKSSSSSVPSTLSRSIFLEPFEQDPVSTLSRLSDFIHPNIFQQYQRKIFAAYMKLRADNDVNGDGDSIQLGKIFLDLEERYLIWINELEELKGEVAGVDIDKTRALLWWHLAYIVLRSNKDKTSCDYLIKLLKYAIINIPRTWLLLSRVIQRLRSLRKRLSLGILDMNIANGLLRGQVVFLGTEIRWNGREMEEIETVSI